MAFLGYAVVDTSGGNCFHKNHYPDAGGAADHTGLFTEITGPFDHDAAHLEYARCLFHQGFFHLRFASGNCSALHTLRRQFATSLDWDHVRCSKFVPDPLDAVFLQPSKLRFRNGTDDVPTLKDALCSEDLRYLAVLARHLPSDRPLTALDAGAHIGLNTLLLARYSKFHSKIISLSSNRHDMQLLRVNTDNVTHLVTRMHGVLVPEALASGSRFLNETTGTLRGYLGRADYRRFQKLQRGTDGFKWYDTASPPPGAGELPAPDGVPTLSLRQLREFVPTRRFDVIRLDMFGTAANVVNDAASREVLCQATCLVVAARTASASAAGVASMLHELEDRGCPASHRLVHVGAAGKYDILCQEKAAAADRARGGGAEGQGQPVRKEVPLWTVVERR